MGPGAPDDSRSVEELTAGIQKHTQWVGRRVRALCPWGKDKELLAAISRKLRMLRAHGLIQKVSHTPRYHVTATGRAILVAVLTTASTTVHQLNQLPKAA